VRNTQQPFYGPLYGTTQVSQYQKKHSPTHHPDDYPVFISFFHLPQFIAFSLLKLRAWQSFCTTSFHVIFGLPLGLEPPPHIPYITSPNQCLLFTALAHHHHHHHHHHHLSIPSQPVSLSYQYYIIYPSLSVNSLLSFTLTLHIHLTILISANINAVNTWH